MFTKDPTEYFTLSLPYSETFRQEIRKKVPEECRTWDPEKGKWMIEWPYLAIVESIINNLAFENKKMNIIWEGDHLEVTF